MMPTRQKSRLRALRLWGAPGLTSVAAVLGFVISVSSCRSFVKARYHRSSASGSGTNYFAITLGLLF